ncbi:MAG TPA: uracil-DNA glycosylase [Candidatus Bathyarchaeia archaeon]|nr:uracil-DNA glycosylase [Candidatus Bathyarchaeia archaeon]
MTSARRLAPRPDSLASLSAQVIACERCPRLVAYRRQIAAVKVRRFRDDDYWGRPLPGFGDPRARLLIVGLAPAAHGGNRTGRMFTGDDSGDWLFRALHGAGFANQPTSRRRDDGLELDGAYISAAARCVPPENRPLPSELEACRSFLVREIALLEDLRVVVALGRIGFDAYLAARTAAGRAVPRPRPEFRHGGETELEEGVVLIASYHPSRQNTQTGRLTRAMLDRVMAQARARLRRGAG